MFRDMHYKFFTFYILYYIIIRPCISLDQASFYGNSYISLPLREAKSSTDIHFKFRTFLPNTLLILVAGSIDHCIVRLDNGKLKVEINLGAGLSELSAFHTTKLNDFRWHKVFITRREANISVIIDDIHKINKRLSGKFFELNINHGLYIGSWKDNGSDIFFGQIENFRGCLSQVMYNGILVLDQARKRQCQATVHSVTWSCAAEFESPLDKPISFIEDEAFMSIPIPTSMPFKLQANIHTLQQDSILFYNPGQKMDLFAIELRQGNLVLMLRHNEKFVEIVSKKYIADGSWHSFFLKISVNAVELSVAGENETAKIPRGFVELVDVLYVGGIEQSKRGRAMLKGLKMTDISFKGCLQSLKIGDRQRGLTHAHVTEGLLAGCIWQYPCLEEPCGDQGACQQYGLNSFTCTCDKYDKSCAVKTDTNTSLPYMIHSRPNYATELELLAIRPLQVSEGHSVLISTDNLHIVLDYLKYGVREQGIKFELVGTPTHGSVSIEVWPREHNVFTLADISRDKVYYMHDGSETRTDSTILNVEFTATEWFFLPAYLQGRFQFVLPVTILPVNDAPILKIDSSTVLKIAQGGKKTINSSLLSVIDPDSTPKQIVFKILDPGPGHFEYVHHSGNVITTFTQENVLNHDVKYVHNGTSANASYLSLQLSDGIETSAPLKIRVSVFLQYWTLQNNTGLLIMHQNWAIITSYNLSFLSNVMDTEDIDAQFKLSLEPKYGAVEVERDIGIWEKSLLFTSNDLKQHRVRYRHISGTPAYDEFQFRTTLNITMVYTFRVTFAKCHLYPVHVHSIKLNGTTETVLTIDHIKYQTNPAESQSTSIMYKILQPPLYGYLYLSISKYRLAYHDVFTQEDLLSQNVAFRFYRQPYSHIVDNILLQIYSSGCKNFTDTLSILYNPGELARDKNIQMHIDKLRVTEGGSAKITSSHIQFHADFIIEGLIFNVTQLPLHGFLRMAKDNKLRNDTNYFTLDELKNGYIQYHHNNAETDHDFFTFMILSDDNGDFEYVDTIHIEIELKNDNEPQRAVNNVFFVVVGGDKLLTGEDLRYNDADIDTRPKMLCYTFRDVPNGEFFMTYEEQDVRITEFTQYDLDQKRVLFRHRGAELGKAKFWVTDGAHHVNGILEIHASAPFIRAVTSKRLIVQHEKFAVITKHILNFVTNLHATDEDVFYEITVPCRFGKLMSSDFLKEYKIFTQANINSGQIVYVNEIAALNADELSFKMRCKDATNLAQLSILMLSAHYWEPLSVNTLTPLEVEECTSAPISKHILEVTQFDVPASAIVYHFANPHNGYISILPSQSTVLLEDQMAKEVRSFSQATINENRVIYVQSIANETTDKLILNVTNGVMWLTRVVLNINIIPEQIFVGGNELRVKEGGLVNISPTNIFIETDYYRTRVSRYVILTEPMNGCIQVHRRCNKLKTFTEKELSAGLVQYAHDSSENMHDSFQLVAIAGEKRSLPLVLNITVEPVNNQIPRLVNNTGIEMWEGGIMRITNHMLAASDSDRPEENLKYQVIACWGGNMSLHNEPQTTLKFFTQKLIDKNVIVFRHHSLDSHEFEGIEKYKYNSSHSSGAKCWFTVSDGLHSTPEFIFDVKTKPVQLHLTSKPLHIFPMQRKYLSSNHLMAISSDPNRTVWFEVTRPSALGKLTIQSEHMPGVYSIVHKFSQNDLNNNKVFYEHTHPFTDLYANDSIVFNVKSHLAAPLLNKCLKIYISVSSGGLDAYVTIPELVVDEGGAITVTLNISGVISFLEQHAGLRAPIIRIVSVPSHHGYLHLKKFPNVTTFTQSELETGQVQYQHDHSDTIADNLYFSLYLLPSHIVLCNLTIPIRINPVNDQPFKLLTPAPHIAVVQGESHIITTADLCIEDADTAPEGLFYDIISGPTEGVIQFFPGAIAVNHFSQADIDKRRILYIHNGSESSDTFHFRVWDTKFRPEYNVFNIKIEPVQLNATVGSPVYIQQGTNVALLLSTQLHLETNCDRSRLRYKIARPPKHGVILVKDNISDKFTQRDFDNNTIMYMQRDMTFANDSFTVAIDVLNATTEQFVDLQIIVQPLMQLSNFSVITGEINKLTVQVLDATALAKLTNSNPIYTIIQQPQYGHVRKIIRSSGEHRNVLNIPVKSFSHEELQSGLIYIVVDDIEVTWSGVQDRLRFILATSIFQPAYGELKLTIRSHLYNDIYSTLAGPNDPAGHEGGIQFASPNMTRDYFLIVTMITGVVILGVTVVIIIKCRSFESDEQLGKETQCLQQPIPLPRPPDRLMVSLPNLKQIDIDTLDECTYDDDYIPSVVPSSLPPEHSGKTSPLELTQQHSMYPYGISDGHSVDEWVSNCGGESTSESSFPMRNNVILHRNQYWV